MRMSADECLHLNENINRVKGASYKAFTDLQKYFITDSGVDTFGPWFFH